MTDLGLRGARLLAALTARDESLGDGDNPMREVAISACRTADRLDRLEAMATEVEPWVETKAGLATHPVLIEVRQQAATLARLVTALRLPDQVTGRKPQARPLRGVHVSGRVSSLELARRRAEGSA